MGDINFFDSFTTKKKKPKQKTPQESSKNAADKWRAQKDKSNEARSREEALAARGKLKAEKENDEPASDNLPPIEPAEPEPDPPPIVIDEPPPPPEPTPEPEPVVERPKSAPRRVGGEMREWRKEDFIAWVMSGEEDYGKAKKLLGLESKE